MLELKQELSLLSTTSIVLILLLLLVLYFSVFLFDPIKSFLENVSTFKFLPVSLANIYQIDSFFGRFYMKILK